MRYPTLKGSPTGRLSVSGLSGGVNLHDTADRIADDQLCDGCNMWWNDGALRTRPGIQADAETLEETGFERYERLGGTYDIVSEGTVCRKFMDIIHSLRGSHTPQYKAELVTVGYDGTSRRKPLGLYYNTEGLFAFLVESGCEGGDGRLPGGAIAFFDREPGGTGSILAEPEEPEGQWISLDDRIYVPLTMINGTPAPDTKGPSGGAATQYEAANLLTPKFRAQYTSDGEGLYYFLPVSGVDDGEIRVTCSTNDGYTAELTIPAGEEQSELNPYLMRSVRVNREKGYLWFCVTLDIETPVAIEKSVKWNNIEITAAKTDPEALATIRGMRRCLWYGGSRGGRHTGTRLFVTGNKDKPHLVHWSEVNNPLYFPKDNTFYVGNAGQPVTALAKQGEKLVIFKEHETYYTTYEEGNIGSAETAGNGSANAAYFPLIQLHPTVGCDCPDTIQLCENHLVWATGSGKVYGLATTNAWSDSVISLLSRNIDRALANKTREELCGAFAYNFEGYYVLQCGREAFALQYLDGRFSGLVSDGGAAESDKGLRWYLWDLGEGGERTDRVMSDGRQAAALCSGVYVDGTNTYLYRYQAKVGGETDSWITLEGPGESAFHEAEIPCRFQTKSFRLGLPEREKNIRQLYLEAVNRSSRRVEITYLTDSGAQRDAAALEGRTPGDAMILYRLTPSLPRVRYFGVRIDSAGSMAVGDMAVKYRMLGRSGRG